MDLNVTYMLIRLKFTSLAQNGAEALLNILESGSCRRHGPVSRAAVLDDRKWKLRGPVA